MQEFDPVEESRTVISYSNQLIDLERRLEREPSELQVMLGREIAKKIHAQLSCVWSNPAHLRDFGLVMQKRGALINPDINGGQLAQIFVYSDDYKLKVSIEKGRPVCVSRSLS